MLDKSNLIDYLNGQCKKEPQFTHILEEALFNTFDPDRIGDSAIVRRIRDINLLYALKFSFNPYLKIERKVTGRALELVVESVLEAKLRNTGRFDYEFVDWKGIDYMVLDKDEYDWIIGIQSKTGFAGGYLGYQKELEKLKEFADRFSKEKEFVMFCGATNKSKKDETRHAFENKGWKFYFLWENINSDKIDDSFYEFTDMIEGITI